MWRRTVALATLGWRAVALTTLSALWRRTVAPATLILGRGFLPARHLPATCCARPVGAGGIVLGRVIVRVGGAVRVIGVARGVHPIVAGYHILRSSGNGDARTLKTLVALGDGDVAAVHAKVTLGMQAIVACRDRDGAAVDTQHVVCVEPVALCGDVEAATGDIDVAELRVLVVFRVDAIGACA